jgi:hypothetical protein
MRKELKKRKQYKEIENKHTIVPGFKTTNTKQPVLISASPTQICMAGGESRSPWQMFGRLL